MAQWEMLILVGENFEIHELDLEKTSCQKKKEEVQEDYQKNWKAFSANPHPSPETENKQTNKKTHRKYLDLERTHTVSHRCERRNEKKRFNRDLSAYSSDQESSDQSHVPSINYQSSADAS
ncbi:TCEB3 [Cervus elaphus hippelaphus]|uniref:TCEB3 n=1 Tax=Cervus elaphus hippelaphus TaxID=46360 RepID=A0A212C2A6_CEREH|nr:TCEB3 [Cervus elaphus hippelaphus]